jgi:hypothetical protein
MESYLKEWDPNEVLTVIEEEKEVTEGTTDMVSEGRLLLIKEEAVNIKIDV